MTVERLIDFLRNKLDLVGCGIRTDMEDTVTDEQIEDRLKPWTLACAVGALNGSIYGAIGSRGAIGFDLWIEMVNGKEWHSLTGTSDVRVKRVLRAYASKHVREHMNDTLRREESRRGMNPSVTIGPGETITVKVEVEKSPRTSMSESGPSGEPNNKESGREG